MGLIDKFKNMFTEEVEEENNVEPSVQIKNNIVNSEEKPKRYNEYSETTKRYTEYPETIQARPIINKNIPDLEEKIIIKKYEPEEPIIKHEEKITPIVEETKVLKREEKFVFPVYFDDKDFEQIEEKPKKVEIKKEPEKKELYGAKVEKKEEQKTFKPTPIISPIYGVLDRNYHKEDISSKKITHSEYRDPSKPLTIDEVRKKAYGTLEDDIENTLLAKSSIFMEPDKDVSEKEESQNNLLSDLVDDNEFDSVDEFLNSPIEDYEAKHKQDFDPDFDLDNTLDNLENSVNETLEKIGTQNTDTAASLDDLLTDNGYDSDDNLLSDYMMNNNEENEETKDEDLTQSDLFNLIDSMYEKGEDE